MTNEYDYIGEELKLFSEAVNWKSYFKSVLSPFIGRCVLEVGAGIGGTTLILNSGDSDLWVCLEPDIEQSLKIKQDIENGILPKNSKSIHGTLDKLKSNEKFDTILYIDVLEHIENDARELQLAADHLQPGGHVIVLSPAHNFLYSPFDRSIGHYRRYNRKMLETITREYFNVKMTKYLDIVGMLASMLNRFLLKQKLPSIKQILQWDRFMIPVSKVLDPLFRYKIGKTIVMVLSKKT